MSPIADVRRDGFARLIQLHRNTARHEMRGSSQANRPATDDGNRKHETIGTHAGTLALLDFRAVDFGAHAAGAHSVTPAQQFSVR